MEKFKKCSNFMKEKIYILYKQNNYRYFVILCSVNLTVRTLEMVIAKFYRAYRTG